MEVNECRDRIERAAASPPLPGDQCVDAHDRFAALTFRRRRRSRSNAVAPAYVNTPLTGFAADDPALRRAWLGGTPMGRMGEPDDGSVVVADGGYTCW